MSAEADIKALDRENEFRSDLRTLRTLVGMRGQRQAGSIAAYVLDLQLQLHEAREEIERLKAENEKLRYVCTCGVKGCEEHPF